MSSLSRLWCEGTYRWLWLAQSLSAIGNHMIPVTIALYVTETTGSTTDVGIVLAATVLPFVLFILLGGVWADRYRRTRIMIGSDLVRVVVQLVTAAVIFAGEAPIWLLAVLGAVFGTAEALFEPALNGLVPQTVSEDLIQEAHAMRHTSYNVASFAGPAIATSLALTIGFGWVFLIDAGTFLVSAVMLTRVRPRERRGSLPVAPAQSFRRELLEGFAAIRSRAWIWGVLIIVSFAILTTGAAYMALGAAVGRDEYGSEAAFGWFQVATGVGAVVGGLVALRWRPRRPVATGVLLLIGWPAGVGLYAVGIALPVALIGGVAHGVAFSVFLVWWDTALAERIPANLLSRVSSFDFMLSTSLMPVGFIAAGVLGDRFAPATVLLVGCVLAIVVIPLALMSRDIRTLRSMDRPPPATVSSRTP